MMLVVIAVSCAAAVLLLLNILQYLKQKKMEKELSPGIVLAEEKENEEQEKTENLCKQGWMWKSVRGNFKEGKEVFQEWYAVQYGENISLFMSKELDFQNTGLNERAWIHLGSVSCICVHNKKNMNHQSWTIHLSFEGAAEDVELMFNCKRDRKEWVESMRKFAKGHVEDDEIKTKEIIVELRNVDLLKIDLLSVDMQNIDKDGGDMQVVKTSCETQESCTVASFSGTVGLKVVFEGSVYYKNNLPSVLVVFEKCICVYDKVFERTGDKLTFGSQLGRIEKDQVQNIIFQDNLSTFELLGYKKTFSVKTLPEEYGLWKKVIQTIFPDKAFSYLPSDSKENSRSTNKTVSIIIDAPKTKLTNDAQAFASSFFHLDLPSKANSEPIQINTSCHWSPDKTSEYFSVL